MENHENFREYLSRRMEEKSLSARKLGALSGIDHATISKIMNGKRKVNIGHLQKLSSSLDIEMTALLDAAGYTAATGKKNGSKNQASIEAIHKMMEITNTYDGSFTLERVEQEITEYQKGCQSKGGRESILKQFSEKLDQTVSKGPFVERLRKMHSLFSSGKGSARELALMGAALLYFIVTADLLPDYLLPIGFMDDALVVQLVVQQMEGKDLSG